jgi:hypothetical protein
MPAKKSVFDLDALIAPDVEAARKAQKWNKVKLFDREWRITTEPNVFAALAGSYGDVEALVSMVKNIVHPEEREDFHKELLMRDYINAEVLMKILTGLIEAAAERPTKSPSGSSGTSTRSRTAKQS